ncbi:MAG: hypothetical protein R6U10_04660 [Thermoplasmatota archaeon]
MPALALASVNVLQAELDFFVLYSPRDRCRVAADSPWNGGDTGAHCAAVSVIPAPQDLKDSYPSRDAHVFHKIYTPRFQWVFAGWC